MRNFEAFVSFLKICTGLGIMVSVQAVSHVGYLVGFISIPMIGLFLTYLLHLQFRGRLVLARRLKVPYLSYSECLKRCIDVGPPVLVLSKNLASASVDLIAVINQFGSSAVCVMYLSSSVEEYFGIPARVCVAGLLPLMMMFSFVNDMKGLMPFNFAAMLLQLVGYIIMLCYIFTDLPPLKSREMVQKPGCWAIFFARFLGATEAVSVVVCIEKNMAKPQEFLKPFGVLNVSMFIIISAYYICGVAGYIKYNPVCCRHIKDCRPLTSLLPSDETPAFLARILYLSGVGLSYGLTCFPAQIALWDKFFKKNYGDRKLFKYMIRMIFTFGTVAFAFVDPRASVPVSLIVNTFCLSFLAIIFPALTRICLLWPDNFGWMNFLYWLDLVLILVGLFFLAGSFNHALWVILQLFKGNFSLEEEETDTNYAIFQPFY